MNVLYTSEIERGPTYSFKPISYKIETSYKEVFDRLQRIQTDLTKIRNQMKEQTVNIQIFAYKILYLIQ